MTLFFSPGGSLNIAADASDLPESGDGRNVRSDSMVRCKNLRINEPGKAVTRDGSAKLHSTAIQKTIWWIEEQGGSRYSFAGTQIYENESSIATGLTNAPWAAMKYNAFNDTTQNIFALNGTDRKRIESSSVREWGIAAPTGTPTLGIGQGTGLTGKYNARYTYVRKVGSVIVAESNPSPPAEAHIDLNNQSLSVAVDTPSDAQVTHIRLYRTLQDGVIYYADQDVPASTYVHGVAFTWEDTGNYLSGSSFKFTVTDTTNSSENTYTWEEQKEAESEDASGYTTGSNWWDENDELFDEYMERIRARRGLGGRYIRPSEVD